MNRLVEIVNQETGEIIKGALLEEYENQIRNEIEKDDLNRVNQLRNEIEEDAFNRGKECGRYNLTRGLVYRCVSLVVDDEFDEDFTDVEIDKAVDVITEDYAENQFDWDFYDDLTSMRLWNRAIDVLQEILNERDKFYEVEVVVTTKYKVMVKAKDEDAAVDAIEGYGVTDSCFDYGEEFDSGYEIVDVDEMDADDAEYCSVLEW